MVRLFVLILSSVWLTSAFAATQVGQRYSPAEYSIQKPMDSKLVATLVNAVGVMNCDGALNTAQLTGKNDVITTAGHSFYYGPAPYKGRQTCDEEYPPTSNCRFLLLDGTNRSFRVRMETLRKSCVRGDRNSDWAVAKLEGPVKGIQPLALQGSEAVFYSGQSIMMISTVDGNQINQMVQDCTVYSYGQSALEPIKTDCLTYLGNSGSAQIVRDFHGNYLLGSIHLGHYHPVDRKDLSFNENYNYRYSAEVYGKFLEAIHEVMAMP
ncbi:MAG: serine protease [Bdellovibrionales bacterium]